MLHASKLSDIAEAGLDHVEFEMEIPGDEREITKIIKNGVRSITTSDEKLTSRESSEGDSKLDGVDEDEEGFDERDGDDDDEDDVRCEICGTLGHTDDACDAPEDMYGEEEEDEGEDEEEDSDDDSDY